MFLSHDKYVVPRKLIIKCSSDYAINRKHMHTKLRKSLQGNILQ